MFSLQGKTAVVTGAGSGIGQAIANTLAAAGAFVYVTDRDEKGVQETVAQITAAGGQAAYKLLDVTSEENCNAVAAEVLKE
jgi:3-oxoacyl-[acyl-carrier protein] reductase